MDSYGMKATLTCVLNDDKYNLGFTFNDSKGNDLDKQLNGNVDNIEDDITKAIMDLYVDAVIAQRKKEKTEPQLKSSTSDETIVINSVTPESKNEDRFAELEEENRRLNDKINSILIGMTSTPSQEEPKDIPVDGHMTVQEIPVKQSSQKPNNSHHKRKQRMMDDPFSLFFDTDFNRFIRELPWL